MIHMSTLLRCCLIQTAFGRVGTQSLPGGLPLLLGDKGTDRVDRSVDRAGTLTTTPESSGIGTLGLGVLHARLVRGWVRPWRGPVEPGLAGPRGGVATGMHSSFSQANVSWSRSLATWAPVPESLSTILVTV